MKSYTVNTLGHNVAWAEKNGYHAYHANGVTAIEVRAQNKKQARKKVEKLGLTPVYIFE